MRKTLCVLFSFFVLFFINPSFSFAYYTNMPASIVVGQANFTSGSADQGGSAGANTLEHAYHAIVIQGKLVVADTSNNRVLIYNSIPTSGNASASVVIGQANFTSTTANQGGSAAANTLRGPQGLATDGTKLIVADFTNNRVLVYNQLPTSNNASADVVIGQPNMTTTSGGVTSQKTDRPNSVHYDSGSGKLTIADYNNSRVLIYNSIPTTDSAAADVVVGQPNFTSSDVNQGGSAAANTLNSPYAARISYGKLFVTDTSNFRVLVFNSIPTSNNASADVVIGQPNMTSSSENQGGTAAGNTMSYPADAIYDGKRLFVVDALINNRILVFNAVPSSNNASADMVLGQANFTSTSTNQGGTAGASTINGGDWDGGLLSLNGNQLIYGDTGNNRILIYQNIDSTPLISLGNPEKVSDQKIRIRGSVTLGERGRYALQKVTASVNGDALFNVASLGGGRDGGDGLTTYDFFHEFNPNVNGGSTDNYYVLFRATSFNGESSQAFHFRPFIFESIANGRTFSFSVNKDHIQRIKNNVSRFEIWAKKIGTTEWKKYLADIGTDKINTEGKVVVNQIGSIEGSGNYEFKIKAFTKSSDYSQDSNTLESDLVKTSPFNPFSLPIFPGWYPLQVNSISQSRIALISNIHPTDDFNTFTTSSFSPTFTGIAFSGSTVAMVVTDEVTNMARTYTAKSINSIFSLKPTLFQNSIIDFSVYDEEGRYSVLSPFRVLVQSGN